MPLGSVLARFLGVLEAPWGVLEGILGLLGDVLARLGARKPEIIKNLVVFGSFFGGSQERLGPSWERLGASFGRLGGAWGHLHGISRLLGDVLARLGARKPEIIKNPLVFQGF